MCGIVAYIGSKSVDSVLLVGLTRLEYRGYDSAGIAALYNGELQIRKESGKIKDLEELLQSHPVEGSVGIGHTRWATHGEPNRLNAHPHSNTNRNIAVVHNGIIENHYDLKQKLIKLGHVFHTETDTEVIPHLIEEELKKGIKIDDALYNAIQQLQGRYAFTMLYDQEPERIFFARDGSPLVYGQGKNESFLASDLPAMVPNALQHLIIENGQWGWIERSRLHLLNGDRREVEFSLETVDLSVEDLDKGGYDHFMLKEIHEQPGVLRRIIQERLGDNGRVHFREKAGDNKYLSDMSRLVITSAGTSWHAALVSKFYFEKLALLATEVDLSSEFRYRNPIAGGDTKVLAISQSGETADTIASIYEAKSKFMRVLSFVNNVNSTIARESNAYINLMAGPEIGVASTKAYTAQLLNLLLYAVFLSGIKWVLDKEERQQLFEDIRKLPEQMESILANSGIIEQWAKDFTETQDFIFLGRSWNYPTALEGALKLKEISYIHASGYAGGEFKHGPIALITSEVPVVCIATQGEIYDKMLSNIEEVRARKGKIISIYTEGDTKVPELSDYSFPIPACPDLLSPILAVVPLQLLAYHVAVERGCEPDQPRNLAKS
ncbi:MAG: glutamine--fructose-6-phosphate transaminase (isomerizing), partial [Leptospiraceae bacterium]|nr:glutamine--fructose-6-phosphate transaminase (isomerizing) [Leptospiraceae bacterium]